MPRSFLKRIGRLAALPRRSAIADLVRVLAMALFVVLVSCPVPVLAAGDAADGSGVAPASGVVTASEALVVGDAARTRFVLDLSGSARFTVFSLDSPDRVVIDLPDVAFALSKDAGNEGRGLVSAFRFGQISTGMSRIVLDVTKPVAVDKSFVLPPADGQPAKLVIDLVATDRQTFAAAVRAYRDREKTAAADSVPPSSSPSDGRMRIVLDPGHGGIDSGAIAKSGTREKDVVLAFALTLKSMLEKSGRYEVLMTRSDDSFISLGGRVAFARAHRADLFVSIHADSFWGSDVRGATIYTLSDRASDRMAAQIAESENKSDMLAGVDVPEDTDEVSDILIDLARRETKNFAVVFARNMIKELGPRVRLFKRAHQQAGFMVLKAPDVPSALVELGYLSSPEDEKLLTSESWRESTADAMTKAIDDYFRTHIAQTSNEAGEPATAQR